MSLHQPPPFSGGRGKPAALPGARLCRPRPRAGQANAFSGWKSVRPTGISKDGRLQFRVLCLHMNTVPSFDGLQFIKNTKVQLWLRATRALPTAQMVTRSLHKGNRKVPSIFLFAHQVSSFKTSLFFSFPVGLFFSISKTVITLLSQLHHRRNYP